MRFLYKLLLLISIVSVGFCDEEQYILYKSGKYQEAYDAYKKVIKNDLANPINNYFFAKSALALGKVDEAISALERTLIIEHNHFSARILLIQIYLSFGKNLLAQAELDTLETLELNKKQLEQVQHVKEKIVQTNNHSRLNGGIEIGYGYTSNVTYGNDITKVIYNIPITNKQIGDHYKYENISLQYVNNGALKNTQLISGINFYNLDYENESSSDIRVLSGRVGARYILNDFMGQYLYSIDSFKLGQINWLNKYTHTFSASYFGVDKFMPTLFLNTYKKLNKVQANYDRDSYGHEVGAKGQYFFDKNKELQFLASYDRELRSAGNRSDVQNNKLRLELSFYYRFFKELSLLTNLSHEKVDYDYDYVYPLSITREDTMKSLSAKLFYDISKEFRINLEYIKKENDSSIFLYQYDQEISQLSMEYKF